MSLKMRSAIQREDLGWHLPALLDKDLDGIDRHGANLESPIKCCGKFSNRMLLQKSEDLDELPAAFRAERAFQATSNQIKRQRQIPVLKGLAKIEAIWLSLQ